MTDDDLVRIIRTGIPTPPMPAEPDDRGAGPEDRGLPAQPGRRARGSVAAGDPLRGRAVSSVRLRQALARHAIASAPSGSRVGPDLTDVGTRRTAAEIERALLDPAADVAPGNRTYRVVLQDGTT
jgi:hypothetical protein